MKLLAGVAALCIVIIIGHTVIVAQPDAKPATESMKAPVAKKVPKVLNILGVGGSEGRRGNQPAAEEEEQFQLDH